MKFENTEMWGFAHAVRGMRNPLESWKKSDSEFYVLNGGCVLGENDLALMQKLIRAGSEHRKFMRQIFVSVDITAPLYWWKEFDTYKVGTVANSTSTMHKLASRPITKECFEWDQNGDLVIFEGHAPHGDEWEFVFSDCIEDFVTVCENIRKKYLETKDKRYWRALIQLLPESWLQTRTVTLNYENLYTMVRQRQNHKLNEWSGVDNPDLPNFISWVKTLPYAEELIFI